MSTPKHPDDLSLISAAERVALSLHEQCRRRFTAEGARAPKGTKNPHKPGSAAATWWQRGNDWRAN